MRKIALLLLFITLIAGCSEKEPIMSLSDAIADGNVAVVQQHIVRDNNFDIPDKYGLVPLSQCLCPIDYVGHGLSESYYENRIKIFKLLIDAGADINRASKDGSTPLHFAVQSHDSKGVFNTEDVKILLDKGVRVNVKDDYGNTPLHYATAISIEKENYEIVKMLIDAGADVTIKNEYGNTPLYAACSPLPYLDASGERCLIYEYQIPIIELLIDVGADVNEGNALFKANAEVTKVLLNAGADIHNTNVDSNTILLDAIGRGDYEKFMVLIDVGTNLNTQVENGYDYFRRMALYPTNEGHIKILHKLLDAGIDVNSKDKNEQTVLQITLQKGNAMLAEELLKAGATIDPDQPLGFYYGKDVNSLYCTEEEKKEITAFLLSHGVKLDE